ncbi:MAG TPA: hypothetical protein VEJ63_02565, partial [Planctomycetota bacterium]|nr:hypothetical protein [Planctomycetota bacterium]
PTTIGRVVDMELGPEPARAEHPPSVPATTAAVPQSVPQSEFARRFETELPPQRVNLGVPQQASHPANPLPTPAVAAPTPELRAQQNEEQQRLARLRMLAMFERNVNIWRSFSIIVTSFTIGWLFYLSFTESFQSEPPWPAIIFNITLIYGLWRASREMKNGPHMMFIAAGIAIVLCMPLNLKLGMMAVTPEMMDMLKKNASPGTPEMTAEQIRAFMLVLFTFAGAVFSIPLWITALKVAALQRLRAATRAAEKDRAET